MKLRITLISFAFILIATVAKAQTSDDVLNLLVAKGTITEQEADSLRADAAIKQQDVKAKQKAYAVNSGGKSFNIDGYTQVRYQYFQNQKLSSGADDGFDVRRARLDFTGSFDTKWDYRLQAEFGGTAGAFLLDGYIVYKPLKDYLKITAGQFILPFSLENITSDKNSELIDRSQVVNALVSRTGDGSNKSYVADSVGNQNGRDVGVQLSGSVIPYNGGTLLDYYVGVFNGAGINTVSVDNNKDKDISTRLVFHPFKILDLGVSYFNGDDKFAVKTGDRFRWGAEAALNYKALTVKSEIISGQTGNTVGPHVDQQGGYVQVGYFFLPKKFQLVAKYDTYDPNTLTPGKQSTYYILGGNYFFNSWAKIQVDYRKAEGVLNSENDLFSTQLQLSF